MTRDEAISEVRALLDGPLDGLRLERWAVAGECLDYLRGALRARLGEDFGGLILQVDRDASPDWQVAYVLAVQLGAFFFEDTAAVAVELLTLWGRYEALADGDAHLADFLACEPRNEDSCEVWTPGPVLLATAGRQQRCAALCDLAARGYVWAIRWADEAAQCVGLDMPDRLALVHALSARVAEPREEIGIEAFGLGWIMQLRWACGVELLEHHHLSASTTLLIDADYYWSGPHQIWPARRVGGISGGAPPESPDRAAAPAEEPRAARGATDPIAAAIGVSSEQLDRESSEASQDLPPSELPVVDAWADGDEVAVSVAGSVVARITPRQAHELARRLRWSADDAGFWFDDDEIPF